MFPTSIAGSLPKPAWLSETQKLWPQWKAQGAELQQVTTEVLLDLAGPHAMARQTDFWECRTDETIGPDHFATTAHSYYMTRAVSIFSGTNEVQRNIVAKAILGL